MLHVNYNLQSNYNLKIINKGERNLAPSFKVGGFKNISVLRDKKSVNEEQKWSGLRHQ